MVLKADMFTGQKVRQNLYANLKTDRQSELIFAVLSSGYRTEFLCHAARVGTDESKGSCNSLVLSK